MLNDIFLFHKCNKGVNIERYLSMIKILLKKHA